MNEKLKILIATGDGPEARYFANTLINNVGGVVGVISEQISLKQRPKLQYSNTFKRIIDRISEDGLSAMLYEHVYMRKEKFRKVEVSERFFLQGENLSFSSCVPLLQVEKINDKKAIEFVARLKPDVLAVQGTSIIKEPLLSSFKKGIINIHGGLPKYRGTWPMFWVLYYEDFAYLNSTIHFIDPGIDTGNIIMSRDLDVEPDDDHYSLRAKYLADGTKLMVEALQMLADGKALPSIDQSGTEGARIYYAKEATRIKRIDLHKRMRKGMLANHLAKKRCDEQNSES